MNTEERVRHQIGESRPTQEYKDQIFQVVIQIFRSYKKQRCRTIHKHINCTWENLPCFIADHLDDFIPPLQSFWIVAIFRTDPTREKIILYKRH